MIKILFICHGNICRSPMAEFVFKDMVAKAGLAEHFHIESRATHTDEIWGDEGNPISPPARRMLDRKKISGYEGKRAQLLVKSEYDEYDYIIGMDRENRFYMERIFGADRIAENTAANGDPRERKPSLLMQYTERGGDVADPWYTRDFHAAYRDIEDGCRGLLVYLQQTGKLS